MLGNVSLNLSPTSTQNFFVATHLGHVTEDWLFDKMDKDFIKNPDFMYSMSDYYKNFI